MVTREEKREGWWRKFCFTNYFSSKKSTIDHRRGICVQHLPSWTNTAKGRGWIFRKVWLGELRSSTYIYIFGNLVEFWTKFVSTHIYIAISKVVVPFPVKRNSRRWLEEGSATGSMVITEVIHSAEETMPQNLRFALRTSRIRQDIPFFFFFWSSAYHSILGWRAS